MPIDIIVDFHFFREVIKPHNSYNSCFILRKQILLSVNMIHRGLKYLLEFLLYFYL